jgi:hypothetical protein
MKCMQICWKHISLNFNFWKESARKIIKNYKTIVWIAEIYWNNFFLIFKEYICLSIIIAK